MLSNLLNKELINSLYSEVPEFKEFSEEYIFDVFKNDAYTIYGPFGSFLRDRILENLDKNKNILLKGFNFINSIAGINDPDIEQMLKVTFFEPLIDYKLSIVESEKLLTGRAKQLLNEVLKNSIFKGGKYSQ